MAFRHDSIECLPAHIKEETLEKRRNVQIMFERRKIGNFLGEKKQKRNPQIKSCIQVKGKCI